MLKGKTREHSLITTVKKPSLKQGGLLIFNLITHIKKGLKKGNDKKKHGTYSERTRERDLQKSKLA